MSIKRIDSSQSGDRAIGNWRIQTMTAMSCAWAAFVRALESVKKLQIGVCHIAHQSSHHFGFCRWDNTRYRETVENFPSSRVTCKFFSFFPSSFLTLVSALIIVKEFLRISFSPTLSVDGSYILSSSSWTRTCDVGSKSAWGYNKKWTRGDIL